MRIFLTGISCVGKTTVGAALGLSLRMPFFDADKEIEAFFQKPIARLQAETLTMYSFRAKAAVAVESLLARKESRHCVVALPPSGLMGAYWRVIKSAGATLVVLADDPKNILGRIVFYDADSRPVHRELSPDEQLRYLREIKNDITYFRRSYATGAFEGAYRRARRARGGGESQGGGGEPPKEKSGGTPHSPGPRRRPSRNQILYQSATALRATSRA